MTLKPVDTAIIMVVGPCIDDTDFKTLEEGIAYNAAGMDISLIIEKTDGTSTIIAITLTTGGTSDWTHKDGGYYEVEITAAQNAEEGIAYLRGMCDGVLPFESSRYEMVKANIYDSLVKGTDKLETDLTYIHGTALTETDGQLAAGFKKLFDVATPLLVASDVMRGTDSAALASDALSNATWTDAKAVTLSDWINGGRLDLILDNILTDTNELQLNQGNWITATGFSIPNEYDTVITALQTDLDNPNQYKADVSSLALEATLTSMKGATFDTLTDSLEAIRNVEPHGSVMVGTNGANTVVPDAAGVVPTVTEIRTEMDTNSTKMAPSQTLADYKATGFSTHAAADIWSSVTRSLTDKSGFNLSTTGVKAIWDQLTSALTTVGSAGKLLVDNINATISSRNAIAPNTVIPDVAGTAATLHGITDGKIDVMDAIVDAIKSKTDNLPSGITKNETLPKFDFLMVLSSDHITGATGKTVTGRISKDGGAFTAITNTITEVSSGMYTIASGFTQTEMNADVITLQFSEGTCDTRIITLLTN